MAYSLHGVVDFEMCDVWFKKSDRECDLRGGLCPVGDDDDADDDSNINQKTKFY